MKHKIHGLLSICFTLAALISLGRPACALAPGDPDLNGDGSTDLIWQNTSTGDVTTWYMAGGDWSGSWDYLAHRLDTSWKIVATADLNGDKKSDLIWQNSQTGDVAFWLMNGINRVDNGYIAYGVPLNWKIVGAIDINGDNSIDLIWQDTQSGDIVAWYLSGPQWTGSYDYLAHAIPTQWRIAGTGNFNSRNFFQPTYHIVFQNRVTEDISYWTMSGTTRTASDYLARSVPLNWRVAAVADLSGDKISDLVWQNTATGDVTYWYNVSLTTGSYSSAYIANGIPLQWTIVPSH